MKLYLEFEPCNECRDIIKSLSQNPQLEESRRFLRHITYNHSELVQGIVKEFPKEEKKHQFEFFK